MLMRLNCLVHIPWSIPSVQRAWSCWVCAGHLDILHLLLEHQQSQAWLRCEGSTPLHMASCLCGLTAKRQQGLEAAKLLLMSKASVFDKCVQPSCHGPSPYVWPPRPCPLPHSHQ